MTRASTPAAPVLASQRWDPALPFGSYDLRRCRLSTAARLASGRSRTPARSRDRPRPSQGSGLGMVDPQVLETERFMASEQDKARLQARVARQMRHWLGREEELRRKQQAKARRAQQQRERPRPNRQWDAEDDDRVFEKMPRRGSEARPRGGGAGLGRSTDLPRAVVIAVHHGRVDLDVGAA